MLIRIVNALLGLYLFTSAFLFHYGPLGFLNEMVTGLLVMGFGIAAILGRPHARRINFGLGVWLFITALALPRGLGGSYGAVVNQVVSAVLLTTTSLFPHQVHYREEPRSA
jgi:hypothetical protein